MARENPITKYYKTGKEKKSGKSEKQDPVLQYISEYANGKNSLPLLTEKEKEAAQRRYLSQSQEAAAQMPSLPAPSYGGFSLNSYDSIRKYQAALTGGGSQGQDTYVSQADASKRVGDTILYHSGQVLNGASSSLEGTADFFLSHAEPIQRRAMEKMQKSDPLLYSYTYGTKTPEQASQDIADFVARDLTAENLGIPLEEATRDRYGRGGKAEQIAAQIENGVGGMLPTVVISAVTGGAGAPAAMAKALGIAGIGISAAGGGIQEALNDGASFDQARLYGAASGAVEAGTEYMFDGIGLLGKMGGGFFDGILKTARPATGLRRILGNALEEGAEEAASGLVNPLLKTIYQGKEALNEYRQPEYWADVAKQAAYGGATALAYSGTIGRLQGAAGKRADVTSITEHMTELEEVRSEKWKAGTLDAKANETINKRLASDYELLSKKLRGMSDSARSAAIRDNGLSSVVRQDGTLQEAAQNVVERLKGSADLTDVSGKERATAAETAAEAGDVKYYTPTMTTGEVSEVLRKGNAKAITTELSREESRNYRDMRQAFSSLQSKTGIDMNLVVAETPQGSNGYYDKATGTVVIGRSRLSGDATSAADAWMATLTHEVYHKTGTTSSGQALTEYLNREDSALYWRSLDSFLRSGYLGDYENSRQIYQELRDKVGAEETLSTSEWETFSAIGDEVTSIMVEKAIGNQRFAADLIAQDKGAIGRLIYRLRQSIEALRSSKNPTEVKMRERFRTAEKMFLDAAAESGYTYTDGKLIGGGEDDDGDVRYSKEKSFSDQIDDVINGEHNSRYDLYISDTPKILKDLNFPDAPLLMRNGKISEILQKHPEMSAELLKKIPDAITDPALILKSKTHPVDSVVIISDVMTSNGEMIVPIWVNQEGNYIDVEMGSVSTNANFVASAYGRSVKSLLEYARDNDGFLYQSKNKNRVRNLLARNGLQLPTPLKISDSDISVSNSVTNVNTQEQKNFGNLKEGSDRDIRYSLSEKPEGKDTDGESEERKTSRVLTELKPKEKSLEERARETWDNMILNFTDDQAAIIKEGQRLGIQDMDAKVNYTRAARNAAQYAMSKGGKQVDIDGREMGPSLSDVFRGAYNRGKEYQKEFYTYLLWMHHADRIRQGKTVMGDYTADEAIQEANRIVTRHPEMRAMAEKVWKYNDNLLKIREQYGLITHDAAEEMRRRYPHYVPTFRAEQGNGTAGAGADSRGMSVRSTIKTAVGSTRDIMPLLDSMAKQTMEVYQAGRLNEMIGTLVDAAEASGDITNITIRSVAEDQAEKKISDAQRTAGDEFAEALRRGEDPVNLLEDAESESYAGMRILDPNAYQNSVSYYRNGKRMIVQVTPEIYHGLKTYLPKAEIGNVLLDLISRGNRTFKELVTSKNPLFVIRNVAKDLQEAAFSTKYGISKFYRNLPRSYWQILKNGKYWQEYQMAGGLSSSIYDYYEGVKASEMRNRPSKDAGAREKLTYWWEKASSSIEYVNMVTEQATRLTEFILAREHGASLQQALLDSADVTTNFSRGGTFAKALNRTIMPFLNPSIQGWSKLTRGIVKTKGVWAWVRLIVKSALLGILPAALNDLINRDNEWYDALPVSDKENYYIIALGKGNFLRIPKGRIQAAVGSLWVHGSEMAKGEENLGEAVSESFGTVLDQVSPVGNFTRNLFSPFTDIATNTTWYGSEIEGASLQSLKPSERYDNRTSDIAILIGKLINYSPKKIHYLIDQYTGVIGDLILPLTSRGNIKYPVISPLKDAFVVSAQTHNRYANDFYNKIDQLTQERNSGDLKSYFALRYLNSAASDISEMYGKKNEIEASDLSITDKRKQSDALTTLIGATQKAALENAEKLERISRTLDYSGRVDAISRSSEYGELDGKQKESVGDRMSDYYYDLARSEMTGEYPGAKQSLMKAMDDDSLFIALAQINRIEGDTDRNGNTVSGSRKKKIMSYIKSLDIPKAKKYMLMGYLGYKNTSGGKDVMEYINGLDLSRAEEYMLYGLSGYNASGGKKEVWNYINNLNMDRENKQKLWKACGF